MKNLNILGKDYIKIKNPSKNPAYTKYSFTDKKKLFVPVKINQRGFFDSEKISQVSAKRKAKLKRKVKGMSNKNSKLLKHSESHPNLPSLSFVQKSWNITKNKARVRQGSTELVNPPNIKTQI